MPFGNITYYDPADDHKDKKTCDYCGKEFKNENEKCFTGYDCVCEACFDKHKARN
jgi:adenine-specific DNA methylase